jgi:rod shape-determining protein MreC
VSHVLSPLVWIKDGIVSVWAHYFALVEVAEENIRLRAELRRAEAAAILAAEERAEILRLRKLLQIQPLEEVPGFGARVIAMRFGPQAALKTLTVNKGFADGALAGTPVVCEAGVVGRVLRSAPNAATVLLLTDPGFRLAVVSQKSRTPGIAVGALRSRHQLEVTYVSQTANLEEGELLVTSGVDRAFPKGIPVGVVTKITPGAETLFPTVLARPAADLDSLEEVVMLRPRDEGPALIRRDDP